MSEVKIGDFKEISFYHREDFGDGGGLDFEVTALFQRVEENDQTYWELEDLSYICPQLEEELGLISRERMEDD